MSKKIILLIISVSLLLIVIFYQLALKKEKQTFDLFEVVRGNISQEVSEVGQLKKGEEINLAFKTSGRIERIYVNVGDEIKKWTTLAKMDTKGLEIQLQQAKSDLAIYQAKLDKLLAGASLEEIKIAETQVENAQIALRIAEENLNNSYETAITVLDSSLPQIYNALDFVKEFVKEYITIYDEDGRTIMRKRDEIERAEAEAKLYLEIAKKSLKNEDVETTLLVMKNSLERTFNNLETIREIADKSDIYREKVSAADKASLDALKTNINRALTNVISAEQTISSMKLNVETAQTKLQEAENHLDLVRAETRQEDVDLYEAQVAKAQSQVEYLENQIQESYLYAPVDGQIIEIKKRVAEMVSSGSEIIVLLPTDPFQIEVDIYEEDIIKISIDNPVDISLVAFPDKIFKGRIISIDPTEKLIEGVVYYQVKISLGELQDGVKPGMTADLIIKTDFRENVLIIPEDAIQEKDGKIIVEILKDNVVEEKEIKVGLEGTSDDMVEVISGVLEGEKIILR